MEDAARRPPAATHDPESWDPSFDVCDAGAGCASHLEEAVLRPLGLYLLFDRSSSMTADAKWDKATAALRAFFGSPSGAGLRIALGFFPAPVSPCQSTFYEVPRVALAELSAAPAPADAHEQALIDAIEGEAPEGPSTPMRAALLGAYEWAAERYAARGESSVVLLVTDGRPEGCPGEGLTGVTAAAAAAQAAGTHTWVVGLEGSNAAELDAIAAAGGTGEALMIGTASLTADLTQALATISVAHLSCEVPIPKPADATAAAGSVNVCFGSEGAGDEPLTAASGADACGGGWYLDPPAAPEKVVLCPETCAAVQERAEARLTVVLGCETVTR
jgi:hypothetical protein